MGMVCPPLQVIDVSNCGITGEMATQLMEKLTERPFLQKVDFSNNPIGFSHPPFYEQLAKVPIYHLHLNGCKLGAHGARMLYSVIADESHCLCQTLKALYTADNDIGDMAAEEIGSALVSKSSMVVILDTY